MPEFCAFRLELLVCGGGVYLFYGINDAVIVLVCKYVCHPTDFGRQKQVQILLSDVQIHK